RAVLRRLEDRLDRAYRGVPLPLPADRAFADTVTRFDIPREIPAALLEGLAWDAEGRRYATLAELHAYAARVAGTVGVMMALVMGVREPAALARACDLGAAMQLTNIARDVGEDARAGRLYLPLDWMAEAGLDADDFLTDPRFTPALGGLVARLLAEASRLYRAGAAGIAALPLACRPGIRAAGLLYAEIGREVARRGHDSVSARAVVPRTRKLTLLARAATPVRTGRAAGAWPLIEEARFLIEAVAPHPRTARRPYGEQVLWALDLLSRVEQRRVEQGAQGGTLWAARAD
ncbi:MAG: phytoene/squalene synthase family protein, partial [Caulobacteraceae bacterium]|nr:phytoene/squalene synthase family protein [Caulobacter sp.]